MVLSLSQIYSQTICNPNFGRPQKWASLAFALNQNGYPTLDLARGKPGSYSLADAEYLALKSHAEERLAEGKTHGYRTAHEHSENQAMLRTPLQKLLGIKINPQDIIPTQRGVTGIYQIAHALDDGLVFMSLPGYPNWIQAINEAKSAERKRPFYHHTEKLMTSGAVYGVNTLGTSNFDIDPELLKWNLTRAKNVGEKVSALLLLYMHNPRGTKLEKDLAIIADIAKENPEMAIIIDAAYMNDRNLETQAGLAGGEFSPNNTKNFHSPLAELVKHYPEIVNQLVILCPTAKLAAFDEGGGVIVCPNQKIRQRIISKRHGEAPDFGLSQASIEMTTAVLREAAEGGIARISQHFRPILDRAAKHANQLGMHPGHKIDGSYYLMCWADGIGTTSHDLLQMTGSRRIETDTDLCLHLALNGVTAMPVIHRPDTMGTGLIRLTATNEDEVIRGLDVIAGMGLNRNSSVAPWESGWRPHLSQSFHRSN